MCLTGLRLLKSDVIRFRFTGVSLEAGGETVLAQRARACMPINGSVSQRNMLLESYRTVEATEAPYLHVRNQFIDGNILAYEALLLPIGVDDKFLQFLVGVAP